MKGAHYWGFTAYIAALRACLCILFLAATAIGGRADVLLFWPSEVFRYDESSGKLISRAPRNFSTETLDSIVPGPDGDLYGLGNAMGAGTVFRFDGVTGEYKNVFIQHAGSIPVALRFGPNHKLYVAILFLNSDWSTSSTMGVLEYDASSGELQRTLIPQSENIQSFGAIDVGPDGTLYIADRNRGILRYSADGAFLGVLTPLSEQQDRSMLTLWYTKNGLITLTSATARVLRIDPTTGAASTLCDTKAGGMQRPWRMAVGPDSDVYVSENETGDIWRFDGRSGSSKGIFIHSEKAPYGTPSVNSFTFFGPRLSVCHGADGPCVKWSSGLSKFHLEARRDLLTPWEPVTIAPRTEGNELMVDFPADSPFAMFRLVGAE